MPASLYNDTPFRFFRFRPRRGWNLFGTLPLDSEFYIVRPADEEFRAAIARGDSIVLVKGARQVGKTCPGARSATGAQGRSQSRPDRFPNHAAYLESIEKLMIALAKSFADQLDLDIYP